MSRMMWVVDVAQLCIFIRMIIEDTSIREKKLSIFSLKGHMRREDTFNDGTPAMMGRKGGFVALCSQCKRIFPVSECPLHKENHHETPSVLYCIFSTCMQLLCSRFSQTGPHLG